MLSTKDLIIAVTIVVAKRWLCTSIKECICNPQNNDKDIAPKILRGSKIDWLTGIIKSTIKHVISRNKIINLYLKEKNYD